ncbi:transposase [Spirosoma fluviale]|uniref:Transposase IS200 like n=1 Tax=Spirosoma fluviale TaxID=1597977 RepID=A0A286FYZ8_9BACT|nr:transposase [Spirosoma fluviale]SOD88473.1 Transposase IS200 like [Spirosoma fluviale]
MDSEVYRRKLPHIQPLFGTFFVTYWLHNSLPVLIKQQLREEYSIEKQRLQKSDAYSITVNDELNRRYFGQFDALLDLCTYCPDYLSNTAVAQIIADSLHFWDGNRIDLIAYCIMPNHVHAVFTLISESTDAGKGNTLKKLMHSIKSFSAHEANKALKLNGEFWEEETYDRLVRDNDELRRIVKYILSNPVKANLCSDWKSWKWTYLKPEYDEFS